MGLFDRFRNQKADHLRLTVEPSIARRGEEVTVRAELSNPDAVQGELVLGLVCRRNERRRGVTPSGQTIEDPIVETYDRKGLHGDWRRLEGRGPWDMRFTIPDDAPLSRSPKGGGRNAWRVELHERRAGARDAAVHKSLIVK
jgi:hypothetical protein